MQWKKTMTGILSISVVTLLVVLAFHVRVAATADSVAILRTTGMTCESCSSKISQALEPLKGVAATEVDVDGGWVIVGFDKARVRPEALAEKVKAAGFYSQVTQVLTPEQFRQVTGKDIGKIASSYRGCCGGKGGCGGNK